MKKPNLLKIWLAAGLLLAICLGCTPVIKLWPIEKSTSPQPSSDPSLANPASINCEQNNGKLVMRTTTQGQTGYCVFRDLSYCEEWAYYRNECKPGDATNFQL
jgi:putative hemolysin